MEEPESAGLYVSLEVNGESRRFLLDTGCGRTTLPWEEWSAVFPTVGEAASGGTFEQARYARVRVSELAIGGVALPVSDLDRRLPGTEGPGLLGIDLLAGKRLLVDLRAGSPRLAFLEDSRAGSPSGP